MTYTRTNLPNSYQPYQTLTVCSNSLIGGGHIVEVAGVLPLIIGKGEKPQVWLQAISNPEKKEFVTVVASSVSKFPTVVVQELKDALIITIQGTEVLRVREISKDKAIVDVMDLRPVGLNLFGDAKFMNMPTGTLSGNSMSGGGVLLGLGS
jgi:hypothetical protein